MKNAASLHQRGIVHKRLLREILLAVALLGVGLVLVPLAVYLTGEALFGPYQGGSGGLGSFLSELFSALAAGRAGAWLLVLSPYAVVTLLRLGWRGLRSRRHATPGQAPESM